MWQLFLLKHIQTAKQSSRWLSWNLVVTSAQNNKHSQSGKLTHQNVCVTSVLWSWPALWSPIQMYRSCSSRVSSPVIDRIPWNIKTELSSVDLCRHSRHAVKHSDFPYSLPCPELSRPVTAAFFQPPARADPSDRCSITSTFPRCLCNVHVLLQNLLKDVALFLHFTVHQTDVNSRYFSTQRIRDVQDPCRPKVRCFRVLKRNIRPLDRYS